MILISIWGGEMRKAIFGAALIVAGLGATPALAGGFWIGNGNPNSNYGNYGVGGWTQHFGVGGWKPNANSHSTSVDKSFSSSSASTATSASAFATDFINNSKTSSGVSTPTNTTVGIGPNIIHHNVPGLFSRREAARFSRPNPLIQKDADCVFRSQSTPDGYRWRPGCK